MYLKYSSDYDSNKTCGELRCGRGVIQCLYYIDCRVYEGFHDVDIVNRADDGGGGGYRLTRDIKDNGLHPRLGQWNCFGLIIFRPYLFIRVFNDRK